MPALAVGAEAVGRPEAVGGKGREGDEANEGVAGGGGEGEEAVVADEDEGPGGQWVWLRQTWRLRQTG